MLVPERDGRGVAHRGRVTERSGRDLITAAVRADEVYWKIGDVLITRATGSTIRRLPAWGLWLVPEADGTSRKRECTRAIGTTVGGNTATCQGRADTLSNWKAYAAADVCRRRPSVEPAQNGMTGPSAVFEGRYGFFKVMSRSRSHRRSSVSLLAFAAPSPNVSTWPILPNRRVSRRGGKAVFKSRTNSEVDIHASRSPIKIMADWPDKWRPQTHETADHSIPYSEGLALMYGKIDPDYYEDPYLHDRRPLDLVSRIKCLRSDEVDKSEVAHLRESETSS